MSAMRIVAFVLALVLLGGYLVLGFGHPVISPRGIVAVAVIPFLFVLVSHSPGEIGRAFADAVRGGVEDAPVERLSAGCGVLDALGGYSLAAGVLGSMWAFLGALTAASRMDAMVKPHDLAPMLAQAFLLPAIGAVLRWFVYAPLAESLRSSWELPD